MGPINGGPINLKSAHLQDAFLRFATLSAADLEAADMSGADVVHARLDQANLSAANLSSALLDYADFTGANLTKVNLCDARLRFANLSAADLEAADMSGADLVHARFDQANLSAANLSSALLDHADFAGANLKKVKLCGASLHHAKNLTHAQLEESIGSDSAILPHYLHEFVSPSVARSHTETTALKRRDLRARARHTADADFSRIKSSNRLAWIVGVLLISGALVGTRFVRQHMNDALPLDTSGAQRESERSLPAQLGLAPGDEGLQSSAPGALMEEKAATARRPSADVAIPPMPSAASAVDRTEAIPLDTSGARLNAPEALMEEKAAAERRLSADPEAPPKPSVANTADRVESAPGERPALERGGQTVPQDANAHTELQAFDGARPSSEAFGPYEHAPGSPEEGHASNSNEDSEASALVSGEAPISTSRHGTVPDLPTEASKTTPEHSSASSLGERLRPPVVTAPLPSSDVQPVLPPRTETPPTPVRNPARQHGAKGQQPEALPVTEKDAQTVLPPSAQTPPTPVRNPAR